MSYHDDEVRMSWKIDDNGELKCEEDLLNPLTKGPRLYIRDSCVDSFKFDRFKQKFGAPFKHQYSQTIISSLNSLNLKVYATSSNAWAGKDPFAYGNRFSGAYRGSGFGNFDSEGLKNLVIKCTYFKKSGEFKTILTK